MPEIPSDCGFNGCYIRFNDADTHPKYLQKIANHLEDIHGLKVIRYFHNGDIWKVLVNA